MKTRNMKTLFRIMTLFLTIFCFAGCDDDEEVNQIMESYVGIVRSNTRLTRAWNRLDILYEETEKLFKSSKATRELCELRNMINVGYLITRQAMERKESRGLHYTIDYPHPQK